MFYEYLVVRYMVIGINTEQHSIQSYDSFNAAKKRLYSIVAGDIDKPDLTYELVQLVRKDGIVMQTEILDNTIKEDETNG